MLSLRRNLARDDPLHSPAVVHQERAVDVEADGEPADGIHFHPAPDALAEGQPALAHLDRKSTRLNSSHDQISYAVFCLKKKKQSSYRTSNPTAILSSLVLPRSNLLLLVYILLLANCDYLENDVVSRSKN